MVDMFDVVGFGAINLDKIYRVDKIPGKDEEGFVKDVELHAGGSSANTIAGLARFGLKTAFIGTVGSDEDGKFLLNDFEREGVDTSLILKQDGRSGNALIFVDDSGNRAILVDPGVNDTIRYDSISKNFRAKLIHLTSFICKNGIDSFESQKRIVEEGIAEISFDPGLIYVERGLNELEGIIKKTTIFMPSRNEIELLMNMDYVDAAKEIVSMGCKIVVVKLGKDGCYISDGEKEFCVKAYRTKPVDTTGAGDAFNAGFIYGYIKGYPLDKCGKIGNFSAMKNIQKVGARAGIPSKKELQEFLDNL
ncbi:Sugar kinase, ribokinase family [Archaeoglobus sulfaticallidus PM70-1]|uniref:Sugar kinase, ribokinase family n=1 Tax=Archaeoglobus sulfaticallidus PM70-1 TaxID=387631 RepID=N0BFK0_9EURY|nr:carbohydrate kinase family protein [Archaeoglobus sulfaticallidus]AGK61022.1 Sugar kinase, ribokinase family [Archaeoglobus sulfaticallidus PM70-1]